MVNEAHDRDDGLEQRSARTGELPSWFTRQPRETVNGARFPWSVAQAIASNRIEGCDPSEELLDDLDEYTAGRLSWNDIRERARARALEMMRQNGELGSADPA